jgi:NAD-dependent deacetylase
MSSDWEVIIKLGAEGGSITLYGMKLDNGEWIFSKERNEIFDLEDEVGDQQSVPNKKVRQFNSTRGQAKSTVRGWTGALELLNQYPWKQLGPHHVHPEFATKILEEISTEKLSPHKIRRWEKATGYCIANFKSSGLINKLKQFLEESNYTVVLTGAGMSTESGLPDFRSAKSGMWNGINPLQLASTDALENKKEDFYKFYRKRIEDLQGVNFHIGHEILANWEEKGIVKSIITQNVDGFHHKAGSKKVYELHGTLRNCHCNDCDGTYSCEEFIDGVNQCQCGGTIRPSVVLFGESLPEEATLGAVKETEKADLFIVLGSSLSVSPANWFPMAAKENGSKVVIVNMEPTELDEDADLIINDTKIGELLRTLDESLYC